MHNRLQHLMPPGQPYFDISGQAAKAAENVARVAAVLHVFDGLEGDISIETLLRAELIVEWHTNQFMSAFSTVVVRPAVEQNAALIEQALWFARTRGYPSVPRQELKFWCPDLFPARLDRGVSWLLGHGRIELQGARGARHVSLVAPPLLGLPPQES